MASSVKLVVGLSKTSAYHVYQILSLPLLTNANQIAQVINTPTLLLNYVRNAMKIAKSVTKHQQTALNVSP